MLSPTDELPAAWLRNIAWAHLVSEGIAGESAEPEWDDACGPAMFCWGAWRLKIRRLAPGAEVDRFGVTVNGPRGLVCELVVASDAVARIETLATATPRPTPLPRPSATTTHLVGTYIITVHSLPSGSAYDDMVRIWSGASQQMGVRGANGTLEETVSAFRDTGLLVTVRAWREDGVADYSKARLVVESIEQEWPVPERHSGDRVVEGWLGRIVPLPAAAAYDDYFDSRWPGGQYGIAADDEALAAALVRLRDAGELVRVWGLLQANADDYGETRILVSRIALAGIGDDDT